MDLEYYRVYHEINPIVFKDSDAISVIKFYAQKFSERTTLKTTVKSIELFLKLQKGLVSGIQKNNSQMIKKVN